MPPPRAPDRFLELLRSSLRDGTLVKLTLGKYRGANATLKNLFVRPVTLKAGARFAFVWRHETRDITKNHTADEALAALEALIGGDFLHAHLFTTTASAQTEYQPGGKSLVRVISKFNALPSAAHDISKRYPIPPDAPWLRDLGVTNERGQPREGMADKFRQIQKFAELLSHLLAEAFPSWNHPRWNPMSSPGFPNAADRKPDEDIGLHLVDAGSGKGYLTFALAALLGEGATVRGIEVRPDLVALCNRIAHDQGFAPRLQFTAGTIEASPLERCDVLIALHACDTATDDALARGIGAGARLLVVAPCCQKELRSQLTAPPVLGDALRHGIFQERQAEFVTDALRAQLLEWAGYRTKVFEFISTEHTPKNLMIAAIKTHESRDPARAERIRAFARFYGIQRQALAGHLGFEFSAGT